MTVDEFKQLPKTKRAVLEKRNNAELLKEFVQAIKNNNAVTIQHCLDQLNFSDELILF